MPELSEKSKFSAEGESSYPSQDLWSFFWEIIRAIIISLIIIVPIRYFLVQPFFVKGASMEDNFHNGDYVLIDEISYRFNLPQRGEVVVFRSPQNPKEFFIKRLIGLPGEKVQIRNNEVVVFNEDFPEGLILDESAYLSKNQKTSGDFKIDLDDNEYFVLGDNRPHSSDSRLWGPVNRSLVTGKVFFRAWPINKWGTFESVPYVTPKL